MDVAACSGPCCAVTGLCPYDRHACTSVFSGFELGSFQTIGIGRGPRLHCSLPVCLWTSLWATLPCLQPCRVKLAVGCFQHTASPHAVRDPCKPSVFGLPSTLQPQRSTSPLPASQSLPQARREQLLLGQDSRGLPASFRRRPGATLWSNQVCVCHPPAAPDASSACEACLQPGQPLVRASEVAQSLWGPPVRAAAVTHTLAPFRLWWPLQPGLLCVLGLSPCCWAACTLVGCRTSINFVLLPPPSCTSSLTPSLCRSCLLRTQHLPTRGQQALVQSLVLSVKQYEGGSAPTPPSSDSAPACQALLPPVLPSTALSSPWHPWGEACSL